MNAARTVASLAADVHGVFGFGVESGVSGRAKAAVDFRVAFGAGGRTHELRAGDFRWCNYGVVESAAGKQSPGHDRGKPKEHRFPWVVFAGCSIMRRVVAHELLFCCGYDRVLARLSGVGKNLSRTFRLFEGWLNLGRLEHQGAPAAPHKLAKANHLLPKMSARPVRYCSRNRDGTRHQCQPVTAPV